jgi:hypothetical protein
MKIISNKKYKELQDLITGLQQDYNDLKDKQVDLQLELKYMHEQKELAEKQVAYLQDELRRANDIKKPTKCKCESALFAENDDGQLELLVSDKQLKPKRVRKPRKEKEDGAKGKNV